MKNRRLMLTELENNLKLSFKDKKILDIALTHSSYANQKKNVQYNERLEYLGDAVLQLTITEYLFLNCKDKYEGELTKIRSLIVCENSLYEIAKIWSVGKYINMSRGEVLTGGRSRVSILADCVEAIIAAIYLDSGLDKAKEFILENFMYIIKKAIKKEIVWDYKTKLQEGVQKNGNANIKYSLIKFEGPPHRRKFFVKVVINDEDFGYGIGYSKKEAEQNAAKQAFFKLED